MRANLSKRGGFTLIESLIYIALFSIVLGGSLISAYQIIESNGRANVKIMIEKEARFIIAKINWALTSASSIITPVSSVSGSSLSIERQDVPANILFDLSGEYIRLNAVELNTGNVKITNLEFTHIDDAGEGVMVKFMANDQPFESLKYLRK